MDYFDEKRSFERAKGIGHSLPIRNIFHAGLNRPATRPLLRRVQEKDMEELRNRVYSVLERLDSIGFMVVAVEREIEDYKAFMKRTYRPGNGLIEDEIEDAGGAGHPPGKVPISFGSGVEEARSAGFALEAVLLFTSALLEYLAQALGLVFRRGTYRSLLKLRNDLRADHTAIGLVALITEYESLCREHQEEGFRQRFVNVDTGPTAYATRRIRDVSAHYRHLRLSGLQLSVPREGEPDPRDTLEPGSWNHRGNVPVEWGPTGGIAPRCRALLSDLTTLVTRAVAELCAEQAHPGSSDTSSSP